MYHSVNGIYDTDEYQSRHGTVLVSNVWGKIETNAKLSGIPYSLLFPTCLDYSMSSLTVCYSDKAY